MALLYLATQLGFETILVRLHGPDLAPASVSQYLRLDIPDAFAAMGLDAWTCVAIPTYDVEHEHAALMASLPSPAFYVRAGQLVTHAEPECALARRGRSRRSDRFRPRTHRTTNRRKVALDNLRFQSWRRSWPKPQRGDFLERFIWRKRLG